MFRFDLQINDMDRHVYAAPSLHVALHPSETEERMLLRVISYCFEFDEGLAFTRGLSTDSEPDLWQHSDDGRILHWIELGYPDVRRIKKALSRSERVSVYSSGAQGFRQWWKQEGERIVAMTNVSCRYLPKQALAPLLAQLSRNMSLVCMIEDGVMHLSWDAGMIALAPCPAVEMIAGDNV